MIEEEEEKVKKKKKNCCECFETLCCECLKIWGDLENMDTQFTWRWRPRVCEKWFEIMVKFVEERKKIWGLFFFVCYVVLFVMIKNERDEVGFCLLDLEFLQTHGRQEMMQWNTGWVVLMCFPDTCLLPLNSFTATKIILTYRNLFMLKQMKKRKHRNDTILS